MEEMIEYNKITYPSPVFTSHRKVVDHYEGKVNWNKIKNWSELGVIRMQKVKTLAGNNFLYDPKKKSHQGKPTHFIDYYALEDFLTMIEAQENTRTGTKLTLIHQSKSVDGIDYLVRDFTKVDPELAQARAMADMLTGFLGKIVEAKFLHRFPEISSSQFQKLLREAVDDVKQLS